MWLTTDTTRFALCEGGHKSGSFSSSLSIMLPVVVDIMHSCRIDILLVDCQDSLEGRVSQVQITPPILLHTCRRQAGFLPLASFQYQMPKAE